MTVDIRRRDGRNSLNLLHTLTQPITPQAVLNPGHPLCMVNFYHQYPRNLKKSAATMALS